MAPEDRKDHVTLLNGAMKQSFTEAALHRSNDVCQGLSVEKLLGYTKNRFFLHCLSLVPPLGRLYHSNKLKTVVN